MSGPSSPPSIPGPGGAAAIELRGVSVFYGEVVGLSNVSLSLGPGITGIVGPNGSGKTTLMRVLCGLLAPVEGEAWVLGGKPFSDAAVRTRIALVPAGSSFHDDLSARRNLEVGFLARGESTGQARALADRALELSRLTSVAKQRYGSLSRGTRQRVKLGLALAARADLVLLDEPFLGVDPPNRRTLRDIMLEMGASGRTMLVSSHVLHEIESLTDRVGVLAHGRLLGFGRIETLLRDLRDQHPHRVELHVEEPRRLAALLLALPHVREVRVSFSDRIEFVTDRPESAYRELAGLVVEAGTAVRRVEALDDGLEAVFRHVTEAGTKRL
jgi:ABC-2 type transport system ATP-binding protein